MENQQTTPSLKPETKSLRSADWFLKKSWEIYVKKINIFLKIMFISFLFNSIYSFFAKKNLIFSSFFSIIMIAIASWIYLALIYVIKEREKKVGFSEAFERTKNKIAPGFWISFLISFAVLIGFFLLIIPGIIFLVWFQFAIIIFASEGLRGVKALSKSKELVSGNWGKVFQRNIVLFVIMILTFFLISFITTSLRVPYLQNIIVFVSTPFQIIYSFLIYENLKEIKSASSRVDF